MNLIQLAVLPTLKSKLNLFTSGKLTPGLFIIRDSYFAELSSTWCCTRLYHWNWPILIFSIPSFFKILIEFRNSIKIERISKFDDRISKFVDRITKFVHRISKFVHRISKFDNIERGIRFVIRRPESKTRSGCIGQLRSVYNFSWLYSTSDRFKPGVEILLLSLSKFADR